MERDGLRQELETAKDSHRDEMWSHTEHKEKETDTLRAELDALAARLAKQEKQAREREAEAKLREDELIQGIESRVKRTVQRKDETISELRVQVAASENKVREFGYLLERQREELLGGLAQKP